MDEETALKFMEDPYYAPWIDTSFLHSIEHELIPLMDYIPKTIEVHFKNYEERHNWIIDHWDDFPQGETWWLDHQILDQCAAGTTWEEHCELYDEFFEKYPQYKPIIKDEEEFKKWRDDDPFVSVD